MGTDADGMWRRRELLRAGARGAAIAAIALAATAVTRRIGAAAQPPRPRQSCPNASACSGCPVLPRCGLTGAISFRQTNAGSPRHG